MSGEKEHAALLELVSEIGKTVDTGRVTLNQLEQARVAAQIAADLDAEWRQARITVLTRDDVVNFLLVWARRHAEGTKHENIMAAIGAVQKEGS